MKFNSGQHRARPPLPLVIFDWNGVVLHGADLLATQVALNVPIQYELLTGIDPNISAGDLADLVERRAL
jgi:hypothetical protein